ncbi:MAG: hypothetical protein CMJ20_05860 [Phycisphaeraceae bacterium]|nr:hypothetical protein [Phycisphaeraceae bacterium]
MNDRQPRGFTLIELLVVISIISLLIAMLLPSVEKARASGEQITCQTNLRQLGVAMETYINDWNDWMPIYELWYEDHNFSKLVVNPDGTWYWRKNFQVLGAVANSYLDAAGDANADILNTAHALWCPSHNGEYQENGWHGDLSIPVKTSASTHGNLAAYGYNHLFLGSQWTDAPNAKKWFYRKKSFVSYPSHIITHGDVGYQFPDPYPPYHYDTKISRTSPIEDPRDDDVDNAGDMLPDFREELKYPIGNWHFKGANVVCLDGHADWETQEKWHSHANDHRWRERYAAKIMLINE